MSELDHSVRQFAFASFARSNEDIPQGNQTSLIFGLARILKALGRLTSSRID